jgi:hypothetical protein
MKISITKKQNRNRVVCTRDDGSFTIVDLGPNLPYNDLAHYVVETELGLHGGFFGNVARGYSFEQLGDKNVILTLGPESLYAEVLAGALGSLATGACTVEQFPELIEGGLARFDYKPNKPTPADATRYLRKLNDLLTHWTSLRDGESLELSFSI